MPHQYARGTIDRQSPNVPAAIAHRAGNNLPALRAAIESGADWVESDIWWHYGRLEARHEHAIWRLPLRYDEWKLGIAVRPALRLAEICRLTRDGPRLLIDLKGMATRLPHDVIDTLRAEGALARSAICSQVWSLLDAAAQVEPELAAIYSIATANQLAALRARPAGSPRVHAVSCAEALLTPQVTRELRNLGSAIFAWTVNDRGRAQELLGAGVAGIISDRHEVLELVRAQRNCGRSG